MSVKDFYREMKKMKKAFGGQGCEIGNAFVENEKKNQN